MLARMVLLRRACLCCHGAGAGPRVSAAATQPVDDAAQIVDLLLAQPVKRPVEQVVDSAAARGAPRPSGASYSRQPPGDLLFKRLLVLAGLLASWCSCSSLTPARRSFWSSSCN